MKRFLSPAVFSILVFFLISSACSLGAQPSAAQIAEAVRQTDQVETLTALNVTRDAFILQASAAAVQTQAAGQTQTAAGEIQSAAETAVARALPSAAPSPAPPTAAPPASQPSPPPTLTALPAQPGPAGASQVKIFLIALEDNGTSGKKIGCGDSVVPVTISIPPTRGVLRAALDNLLGLKSSSYGASGLYNSLYASNLSIDSLAIQNGIATIRLKGTLSLGGVCDSPRVKAQLEETARQFSTVSSVNIFINDRPLDDLLSGQG